MKAGPKISLAMVKLADNVEFSRLANLIGKAVEITLPRSWGKRERWYPNQNVYEVNLKMVNDVVSLGKTRLLKAPLWHFLSE